MMRDRTDTAGGIYGTILVMAVIWALSEDGALSSAELLAAVLATSIVFWIAHVYARTLSRLAANPGDVAGTVRRSMVQEWPMIEADLVPAVCLLLGVVGLVSRDAAVNIALGACVAMLFAWGHAVGRRFGFAHHTSTLIGFGNCALGLALVGLKLVVH